MIEPSVQARMQQPPISYETYMIIWWIGLAVALVGAYFIATFAFRRVWKDKVTHPKLIGFLVTFIVSFAVIEYVISYILSSNFYFGR